VSISSDVDAAEPQLSIVMPTHDRYAQASRALTALSRQILGHGLTAAVEVLLVDDASKPACVAKMREFLRRHDYSFVRYAELAESKGAGGARNAGVAASRGRVIAFLDDDVVPGDEYVSAVMRAHATHPDALVIHGNLLPLDHDVYAGFWFHYYDAVFNRAGEDFYAVEMLGTNNVSMKRSVLALENPLFDSSLTAREDFDLYLRLRKHGVVCYKDDGILAFNEARSSLLGFVRQRLWYDRGQQQLIAKHGKAALQMQAGTSPNRRYAHLYFALRVARRLVRWRERVRRQLAALRGKRRVREECA
jgi:glycosyltransferase involved in cell wall biosynthesis